MVSWRQFSHSQFMTDNMRQHMREVVMTSQTSLQILLQKLMIVKLIPSYLSGWIRLCPATRSASFKPGQQKQENNG